MPTSRLLLVALSLAVSAPVFSQGYQADPFAGDPTVDEAVEAATRRFNVRVEDMNGYRRRAGASGLLPDVQVSMRTRDSSLDLEQYDNFTFPDQGPATVDDGTAEATEFAVTAGWDLSRVVFNPDVLEVNAMIDHYDEIAEEVINLYFLRQRLILSLHDAPPSDAASRQALELRIAQATASLNALTGGLFD